MKIAKKSVENLGWAIYSSALNFETLLSMNWDT